MKSLSLILLFLVQSASAASATRVNVKQMLPITEGDYSVVSADSAIEKENLCIKGTTHQVKWSGSDESPILSIGAARLYMNFNSGLVHDSEDDSKTKCIESETTQTLTNRIIEDDLTNCEKENTTSHTEIKVVGDSLEYTQDIKVSRAGKVISIPAKCTLQKIKKP